MENTVEHQVWNLAKIGYIIYTLSDLLFMGHYVIVFLLLFSIVMITQLLSSLLLLLLPLNI